jgi:hypothetical protein
MCLLAVRNRGDWPSCSPRKASLVTDCNWPGLPVRNRARKLTVGTMAWPANCCFPLLS